MAAALLICATWCSAEPTSAPTTAPAPRELVQNVASESIAMLRDTTLTIQQRGQKIRELAEQNVDFEILSRLAMGRNWAGLTDAQRDEFHRVFEQHILNTFAHLSERYGGQDLRIVGDRAERDGDCTVRTSIVRTLPNGAAGDEVAKVDFRLRPTEKGWKVIDLTSNGISMLGIFRAQFQSLLTSGGGIEPLLQTLRDKNASAEGAALPHATTAPARKGT